MCAFFILSNIDKHRGARYNSMRFSSVCCAFMFMHVERKRNRIYKLKQRGNEHRKTHTHIHKHRYTYRDNVMNVIEN